MKGSSELEIFQSRNFHIEIFCKILVRFEMMMSRDKNFSIILNNVTVGTAIFNKLLCLEWPDE